MRKLPEIVPVSDLRQDAAKVLKRVRDSNEPLIITQRGRAAAVMISPFNDVELFDMFPPLRESSQLHLQNEMHRMVLQASPYRF